MKFSERIQIYKNYTVAQYSVKCMSIIIRSDGSFPNKRLLEIGVSRADGSKHLYQKCIFIYIDTLKVSYRKHVLHQKSLNFPKPQMFCFSFCNMVVFVHVSMLIIKKNPHWTFHSHNNSQCPKKHNEQ